MNADDIAARVRERCGLEVQAVSLARAEQSARTLLRVWTAMTEYGHFWAVEDGARIELFRAVPRRTSPNDHLSCGSAVEATRRFLALHPVAEPAAQSEPLAIEPATRSATEARACESCGSGFTPRRRADGARTLCPRCRHAERERLRYQLDPRYRARRLAYSAARYRKSLTGDVVSE